MIKTEERERNIAILNEYKSVGVMQLVGDKYGISRERVRQIVSKYGYKKPTRVKLTDEEKAVARYEKRVAKFHKQTIKSDGCWEWLGCKDPAGYGHLRWNGRNDYAHRVAWIIKNGEIPDGLHVCHHCDNPGCVNTDHMFLGTVADNMHDRDAKGRNNKGKKLDKKTGKLVVTK